MKKTILISTILSLTISCKNKTADHNVKSTTTISAQENSDVFAVDSLKVMDSVQVSDSISLVFEKSILVFKNLDKALLDSIYRNEIYDSIPLKDYSAKTLKASLDKQKLKYFDENKSVWKDFPELSAQTWDSRSSMKVKSDENGFLTLRYTGSGYTGGAHGYAYEIYKVFDKTTQKQISLEEIMNIPKEKQYEILMKHIDKEMLFNDEFFFTNNFYFNKNGITFSYGQYEIGPYSSGIIEIAILWSELKPYVRPEFWKRINKA